MSRGHYPPRQALGIIDRADAQRLITATVDATGPTTITVNTQTGLPASNCAAYTPTISDVVLVLQNGDYFLIIDKIA